MQEDLLQHIITPDLRLEAGDGGGDTDAHGRRAADEDGGAAAQNSAAVDAARRPLPQHVAEVRTPVLDAPAPRGAVASHDLVRHGKCEPHQALLELRRRLGEPEVEPRWRAERRRRAPA